MAHSFTKSSDMPRQPEHYEHEKDPTVYEIGRGVAWIVGLVFMALLWLPPLGEHLHRALSGEWKKTPAYHLFDWTPGKGPIVQHLHDVEHGLDKAEYSTVIRQKVQGWLSNSLDEGNARVYLGYNGWLFYQPDITALTGYGPMAPEPFSIMKDPELAKLSDTKDLIAAYAEQLKERGISLLLVPLPLKPMIYSENITGQGTESWITHPDAPVFYDFLRSKGVDVLDLTDGMAKLRTQREYVFRREPAKRDREVEESEDARMKKTKEAFLMQDTHWTPEGMRYIAEQVAAHIKKTYPQALQPAAKPIRAVDGGTRSSMGDLVKLLDVRHPEETYEPEKVFLRMIGDGTENKDSNIVLLGDSFVNIFNDPDLGFGNPTKPDQFIHAGFAQHLSLLLNQPLDVYAITGKGSTGVRQDFAKRYDDEVRAKKLVVWVIAARDVLLSKNAAHAANITWAPVTFNPNRKAVAPKTGSSGPTESATPNSQEVVVIAKMTEKSKNQSLDSPYRNALHTAVYDVEQVVSGKLDSKQLVAVEWTFQDKKMSPTSNFAVGQRYRLTLVPWDQKKELHNLDRSDDVSLLGADEWYVVQAEPAP